MYLNIWLLVFNYLFLMFLSSKFQVRVNTRLLYQQTKFNLLREESEGYSKLVWSFSDSSFFHTIKIFNWILFFYSSMVELFRKISFFFLYWIVLDGNDFSSLFHLEMYLGDFDFYMHGKFYVLYYSWDWVL